MPLIGWTDVHTASIWRDIFHIALLRPIIITKASYTYISCAHVEVYLEKLYGGMPNSYWGALFKNELFLT